jgi:rhodanese-related sulfurtransferase
MAALLLAGCAGGPGGRTAGPEGGDSAMAGQAGPGDSVVTRQSGPAAGAPMAGGTTPAIARPGRMTASGAREFLASHPEALVLDVRNPDEWDGEYGHIEGARLLPLPELADRAGELEDWKEKPIVLVCRSGRRSQTAAELLAGLGYQQVINLDGGMIAWRETEKPKP